MSDVLDLDFIEDIVSCNSVGRSSTRISLSEFLRTYVDIVRQGGNSIDVAKELGISPQGVRQRAGKLIKMGVKLPKLGNICRKQLSEKAEKHHEDIQGS